MDRKQSDRHEAAKTISTKAGPNNGHYVAWNVSVIVLVGRKLSHSSQKIIYALKIYSCERISPWGERLVIQVKNTTHENIWEKAF